MIAMSLGLGRRMGPRFELYALAVVAASFLVGCSTTAPTSSALGEQLEQLRSEITSLHKKNTVTEIELQRLRVKVAELEVAARQREPVAAREVARAQPLPVPARTGPETPIEQERRGTIESVDLVPPDLRAQPPVAVAPSARERVSTSGPATSSAGGATAPPGVMSEDAQRLYDQGYTQYNQSEFVEAEATFQRYLLRYPGTSLADNAQFWIAESRYGRGDLRGALAGFRETVSRFPEGNKAPDALLRAGRCLEGLGDQEAAVDTYRELVRRFPESADALIAADRVQELGG